MSEIRSCEAFDWAWQARLDQGATAGAWDDQATAVHLRHCARCRQLDAGYRLLVAAIAELPPAAEVPAATTERLFAALVREAASPQSLTLTPRRRLFSLPRMAAAAALLAAAGVFFWSRPAGDRETPRVAENAPDEVRPLSDSLYKATSATLSLARSAAEPARHVGRVFVASRGPATEVESPHDETSEPAPRGVIRTLRTRVMTSVEAGVEPLSRSARRAFGFVVSPDAPADSAKPTRSRGA